MSPYPHHRKADGLSPSEWGQMQKNSYVLTDNEFEVLRLKLEQVAQQSGKRFSEENVSAAYTVMVNGVSVPEAAKTFGRTRQNLHRVVRDLAAIYHDAEPPSRVTQRQKKVTQKVQPPQHWVRVNVTLPPDQAATVYQMEHDALVKLDQQNTEKDSTR
jgi:hypothetical protein